MDLVRFVVCFQQVVETRLRPYRHFKYVHVMVLRGRSLNGDQNFSASGKPQVSPDGIILSRDVSLEAGVRRGQVFGTVLFFGIR